MGKRSAPEAWPSLISAIRSRVSRTTPARSRGSPRTGVLLTAASIASAIAPASGKRSNGERARHRRSTLSNGLGTVVSSAGGDASILCAISAAYTTVRPGSDTTSTAAGTAIGIALVPPLCVVGYGIGTSARPIWSGAALLFTANFCAILLFAVICFLTLGYGAVSSTELERAELERQGSGPIRRVIRTIQVFFGLRYGRLFRVLMPLVLV